MSSQYLVVVVGGAVSGSEGVSQLREKGFTVVCIEQNALPYGKIEDGLPRWHVEQRLKEQGKIDERIDHPLVHFLPSTKLGVGISFDEINNNWKPNALLLANGAWLDRSLGISGVDDYVNKGLVYQNPLVYWFNHNHEAGYKGPRYEIPDGTAVVGGGLASLDVMKICQIELVGKALKARGITEEMLTIEKEGVPGILEKHGLKWEDLHLKGSTLYYRRRALDMPLADTPPNATEEQKAKSGAVREKILGNYQRKFLFNFEPCNLPVGFITEGGKLVGLKLIRTKIEGGKVINLPGTEFEVRSNLFIGSIGSVPEPIAGLPVKGETYEVKDETLGEVVGLPKVYAMGNAVTGKGNIRVSMLNARQVTQHVISKMLDGNESPIGPSALEGVLKRVKELQAKVGYDNNYRAWVEKQVALRNRK